MMQEVDVKRIRDISDGAYMSGTNAGAKSKQIVSIIGSVFFVVLISVISAVYFFGVGFFKGDKDV